MRKTDINFTNARAFSQDDVTHIDVDLSIARTKPTSLGLAGAKIFISDLAWNSEKEISSSLSVGQAVGLLNNNAGVPIGLTKGQFYDIGAFDDIYILNTAQSGKMMRVYVSVDTTITPFSSELAVLGGTAASVETTADASILTTATTQVLAANADRISATISNLSANGTVLRVGDASTGATRGAEIPVGGSAVLNITGAIYVYNPSGGTVTVGLAEEDN